MPFSTLTKQRIMLLTIPLFLSIACVAATAFIQTFSSKRLSNERLLQILNGVAAALAVVSILFLSSYARFKRSILCFLVPLFFTVAGILMVVLTYKDAVSTSEDPPGNYISGLFAIGVSLFALVYLFVLWVLVGTDKFTEAEDQKDGVGEPVEAPHEDVKASTFDMKARKT